MIITSVREQGKRPVQTTKNAHANLNAVRQRTPQDMHVYYQELVRPTAVKVLGSVDSVNFCAIVAEEGPGSAGATEWLNLGILH